MGLLIGSALAGLVLAVLWHTRLVRGAALQLLAAALLFGLAGYALQGRAGLAGSPAAERRPAPLPPAMPRELTAEFYGEFNAATPWIVIADGYMARGDGAGAVATLTSAIRASPRTSELWVALGNALVSHNGGRSSPASDLAFEKGIALAPEHPGPRFFYGLMLLQQGQVEPGLGLWRRLLQQAPTRAAWRVKLAERIAVVEQVQRRSMPDLGGPNASEAGQRPSPRS